MLHKKYYFLCSVPRAGNTIFSSFINQSEKVKVTANSVLPSILFNLDNVKQDLIYKNFPDEKSYLNVYKNIIKNYYKEWQASYIIDRGPWGTPKNLQLLKLIIPKPKFIILYRPVLECLASFIKVINPSANAKNNEMLCDYLLSRDDNIGKSMWSIQNIISNKEDYIIINYDDFVLNPNVEVKKIFKFLKIPFKSLNTSNISQFSINDVQYNDGVFNTFFGEPLHTIRNNKIEKNSYKIEDYLPKKIIEKYSEVDKTILQHEYK